MSTLANEILFESTYNDTREEVIAELQDTGDLPMYTEREIQQLIQQRFQSRLQP